ncbi:MAG: CYTH domain-containing protein [Candidatus Moranbacteria bacterium]|nr:CYTH domain-containing protein [Candidatus Moranbacteria bacterium]
MQTEYEATFANIEKEALRRKLTALGARLVRPEFLQKRVNFHLPKESQVQEGWLRVRDEGEKVTISIKSILNNDVIEGQKELCLEVNDFEKAKEFCKELGCKQKAYQESKREIWMVGKTEICIDEWPWLEPFVEIEGKTEEEVKSVSEKLGFSWKEALFGAVDIQYEKKYGISKMQINNKTPRFVFGEKCPFK